MGGWETPNLLAFIALSIIAISFFVTGMWALVKLNQVEKRIERSERNK